MTWPLVVLAVITVAVVLLAVKVLFAVRRAILADLDELARQAADRRG